MIQRFKNAFFSLLSSSSIDFRSKTPLLFFWKKCEFWRKNSKKADFYRLSNAHVWSEYGTQAMKQKNLLWFNISIFSAIFCLIQRISSFSFCASFCLFDEWNFDLLLMIYQAYHIMTLYISIICIIVLFVRSVWHTCASNYSINWVHKALIFFTEKFDFIIFEQLFSPHNIQFFPPIPTAWI